MDECIASSDCNSRNTNKKMIYGMLLLRKTTLTPYSLVFIQWKIK